MKVLSFKPYSKGTLEGFVELALDSGICIRGMTYHKKDGQSWINFPSRAYEDESGETKYQNILYIADDQRFRQFQKKALEALDLYFASNKTEDIVDDEVPF